MDKPLEAMTEREMLAEILTWLRAFEPVLAAFRPGNGGTYVQAAGLRRSLKRAAKDAV